jgi:hypothetical protein
MTSRFAQWTLDVQDVRLMATFWSQALGYQVEFGEDGGAKLYPPPDGSGPMPPLWLQASAPSKAAKNRSHPDLRPVDGDVEAEVDRLLELGARHVDVGQKPDDPFVVLADPEGNEFCILRRDPLAARA